MNVTALMRLLAEWQAPLSTAKQNHGKFIILFCAIGFFSDLTLIGLITTGDYDMPFFLGGLIVAVPLFLASVWLTVKGKVTAAATMVLLVITLGCAVSTDFHLVAHVTFMTIFLFGVQLSTTTQFQTIIGYTIVTGNVGLKFLGESTYWSSDWYLSSDLPSSVLWPTGIFFISILSYSLTTWTVLKTGYAATDRLNQEIVWRKNVEANLQVLASVDSLTGIANRRRFDELFEDEWKRCSRSGEPLSIILADVDFFKKYNDHYGHVKGDEVLQKVAGAMASAGARPGDLVARYGGEEFVCALPEISTEGAYTVAERMLEKVRELGVPHVASDAADHVSLSLGIATIVPEEGAEGVDRETLLLRADEALYTAKSEGRNRVAIYGEKEASLG